MPFAVNLECWRNCVGVTPLNELSKLALIVAAPKLQGRWLKEPYLRISYKICAGPLLATGGSTLAPGGGVGPLAYARYISRMKRSTKALATQQ